MADDDLAYGEYHGQGGDGQTGDRGIIGDTFRRLAGGRRPGAGNAQQQNVTQAYQPHLFNNPTSQSGPTTQDPPQTSSSSGSGISLLDRLHQGVHQLGTEIKTRIATGETHSHTHATADCHPGAHDIYRGNRYFSFAPQRPNGNDVKWYVDGCGYMWAVSKALESARESIWILDWWLSPELYLRRPPAKNEQYRVDNLLKAAAERGVKVNIIVYKEVTQALTRKYLRPSVPDYLHSMLPSSTDPITKALTKLGLWTVFESLERLEQEAPLIEPPISVSSSHTKHHLEDLHPNICVFRHPDHLPDRQNMAQDFVQGIQNLQLSASALAKMPGNALSAIYGSTDDTVLYWAHHEKLCLIDGSTAFMGGLDLCYGRWDTNQHSISDAHPGDLNRIVFPGQDYNNSRIMDFQDVVHWQNNKLDRTENSRMGWTDLSICISGPVVQDLREHFVQRWNFIYAEKYRVRKDDRYSLLSVTPATAVPPPGSYQAPPQGSYQAPSQGSYQAPAQGSYQAPPPGSSYQQNIPQFAPPPTQAARGIEDEGQGERGFMEGEEGDRSFLGGREGGLRAKMKERVEAEYKEFEGSKYGQQVHEYAGRYGIHAHRPTSSSGRQTGQPTGFSVQLARSCAKWSHGVPVEHSIANAYIDVIKNSEYFVYIENQFFITAVNDRQKPIKNKIGAAIVERAIRAARNGENWRMIVLMPAIPAFAGDLRHDDALSTRAIMEFQYNSINRGGDSIYESIARAGYNPMNYIRFYNLRNYDRINTSAAMRQAEQISGVKYEDARKQFDETYAGGFGNNVPPQNRGIDDTQSRDPYPGQPQLGQGQQSYGVPPTQPQYQAYHPSGTEFPPPPPLQPQQSPLPQQSTLPQQSPLPAQPQTEFPAELPGTGYQLPPPPSFPPPPSIPPPPQQHEGYGDYPQYQGQNPYGQYQEAAQQVGGPMGSGRWDSVAECYMLNGEDIRQVPWEGSPEAEIDAFVTEELYIHSKLLIADDRIVICGSANLNDRSQLGDHDSEIAVVIEDHNLIDSTMNGRPWKATKFAASLRRQIFKKHLGLLPPQDYETESANYLPVGVPNDYKFGTEEDSIVVDPLDDGFLNLWNSRARTNTQVFGKVFHPVPHDSVLTWKDYDEWYEKYFREADPKDKTKPVGKYKVGHVVAEEFPGGVQQVKEELSKVKGTLVEMPLLFLKSEDIAKEGLGLNAFTEEVYT